MSNYLKDETVTEVNGLFSDVVQLLIFTEIDEKNYNEVASIDATIWERLNSLKSTFEPRFTEESRIEYEYIMNEVKRLNELILEEYNHDVVNNPGGAINTTLGELAKLLPFLDPFKPVLGSILDDPFSEIKRKVGDILEALFPTTPDAPTSNPTAPNVPSVNLTIPPANVTSNVQEILENLRKFLNELCEKLSSVKNAGPVLEKLKELLKQVNSQLEKIK